MTEIHSTKGRAAIRIGTAVSLACLAVVGGLQAQSYDNPGLGELPVVSHPQDYKPLGIRAGGFMLHPGVHLAAEYTDNAFYSAAGEESDTIYHVRPYITAQSNWNRHALNVRLAADIARYKDFGIRDYEDYFLTVSGRLDVRSRSFMTYSLDYMNLHEGLNARDSEQGLEPTRYDLYGGGLGYDQTFNRLSVGALYTLQRLDFDDALAEDGTFIDNQDRDRDTDSLALRVGYQLQTEMQVFASYRLNRVRYDQAIDRNGYNRDSDGWTASAGLRLALSGLLNGDISVNYHDQSYDDPGLPNVSGWAGGAGLQWRPAVQTSVGAHISSAIQPTTDPNSSGYLRTLYTLRADHELRRNLQLSGQVSYRDNDYHPVPDAPADARAYDAAWVYGASLSYFVNRYLFFSAAYEHQRLKSNIPLDRYEVNQIWLTLSLEL
jgi:hypothetical protein